MLYVVVNLQKPVYKKSKSSPMRISTKVDEGLDKKWGGGFSPDKRFENCETGILFRRWGFLYIYIYIYIYIQYIYILKRQIINGSPGDFPSSVYHLLIVCKRKFIDIVYRQI
jgi:hypothetical protein